MRIQFEDYFGNDIIKLEFCLKDKEISKNKERQNQIQSLALDYGYSIADIDIDEQGEYVRLQQVNYIIDEDSEADLLILISNLTANFI